MAASSRPTRETSSGRTNRYRVASRWQGTLRLPEIVEYSCSDHRGGLVGLTDEFGFESGGFDRGSPGVSEFGPETGGRDNGDAVVWES
jgi:hypothetical protein